MYKESGTFIVTNIVKRDGKWQFAVYHLDHNDSKGFRLALYQRELYEREAIEVDREIAVGVYSE